MGGEGRGDEGGGGALRFSSALKAKLGGDIEGRERCCKLIGNGRRKVWQAVSQG